MNSLASHSSLLESGIELPLFSAYETDSIFEQLYTVSRDKNTYLHVNDNINEFDIKDNLMIKLRDETVDNVFKLQYTIEKADEVLEIHVMTGEITERRANTLVPLDKHVITGETTLAHRVNHSLDPVHQLAGDASLAVPLCGTHSPLEVEDDIMYNFDLLPDPYLLGIELHTPLDEISEVARALVDSRYVQEGLRSMLMTQLLHQVPECTVTSDTFVRQFHGQFQE